jgi:hypothetical protein
MKISNNPTAKNERRIGALARLEYNYKSNELNTLTLDRMNKEMKVLVGRIVDPTSARASARASRSKIYRGPK